MSIQCPTDRRSALRIVTAALMSGMALPVSASSPVTDTLVVTGAVRTPLKLSLNDLRELPAAQMVTVELNQHRAGPARSTTVRGVRLSALVELAGLVGKDRHAWKCTAVIATASDGYKVLFSWPELINTEVGSQVLVIFERDGQALDESEGPIALVSGRDLRGGPRHVRWLSRIDIQAI